MNDHLELRFLNGFQVTRNERVLNDFVSNKARAIVAYLFVTKRPQPREVLATLLWGDMPEQKAHANLRVALSNLRRLLGPHIQIDRETIAIGDGADYCLDVDEFQAKTSELSGGSVECSAEILQEAMAEYESDFLEGFHIRDGSEAFEEWAMWQRERLRQLALRALYRLSVHHTERGNYRIAIDYTARLLALEPWQEEAHRQMMLLQALVGNRAAALAQYETCRRILAKELHVEPLPETNALLERIKAATRSTRPEKLKVNLPDQFTLFGREKEQQWLTQQWRSATKRPGRFTFIQGEMGIGKTALVDELLQSVTGEHAITLRARCHEFGNAVPFQPVSDLVRMAVQRYPGVLANLSRVWLQELVQLLPELADKIPDLEAGYQPNNPEVTRQRLFEAICQLFAVIAVMGKSPVAMRSANHFGRRPTPGPHAQSGKSIAHAPREVAQAPAPRQNAPALLIIFIDDMQWIDSATVDLLRYMAFRTQSFPLWLIGAYQREGMEMDHPMLNLRRSLISQERADLLRVEPLSDDAVAEWIQTLPGLREQEMWRLVSFVLQRSEGNPYIMSQMLQELKTSAMLQRHGGAWQLDPQWSPQRTVIPFAVREMVLLKLGRLSLPARNLLAEAAIIGQHFDLETLQEITGHGVQVMEEVRECLDQGLIKPDQPGTYRFTHTIVREIVAERLSHWLRQQAIHRNDRRNSSNGTSFWLDDSPQENDAPQSDSDIVRLALQTLQGES